MSDKSGVKKDSPPWKVRRTWKVQCWLIGIYSLVGLSVLSVDFFGFKKVTQRYSENIFYNVMAPKYGTPFFTPTPIKPSQAPTLWNQNISVILLDD
jgi:hypothetical protein